MKKPRYVDTQVIDDIDADWLKDAINVLDIGSGDGTTNLASKHGEWFREMDVNGRYFGVDAQDFKETKLKGILAGADINDMDFPPNTFDCILCINVLEHIPFENWGTLFWLMKHWLMVGGRLIITVPFKQGLKDYAMRYPPPVGHCVFDITDETFEPFIDGLELIDRSIEVSNTFDGDGANIVWASLRWLKRFITRHPYRRSGKTIMLLYRKK